jgi:hypothetical protein
MDSRTADGRGRAAPRHIFVIGTGRSGTHCLAGVIASHPDVRATIEEKPMFDWSVAMAVKPACERRLFDRLVAEYAAQLVRSAPKHYLDKSHPNIWIADKLLVAFPRGRFIGVQRHPYATVASMLRHGAVSSWHRHWKSFPVPNRFLGITMEWSSVYDSLPMASRCALRWKCHYERMQVLRESLGPAVTVIWYEALVDRTERVIRRLEQFLDLRVALTGSDVRRDSLEAWRSQLSVNEVAQIRSVVGRSPNDWTEMISADGDFV